MSSSISPSLRRSLGVLLASSVCVSVLSAQGSNTVTVFTVDWQGPTQGTFGTGTGAKINESDILGAVGGQPSFDAPVPFQVLTGGDLGLPLYSACDPLPGDRCTIEVDAFSSGVDLLLQSAPGFPWTLSFSADEYAQGITAANINALRDDAPLGEVAADIYARPFGAQLPIGPPPLPRPLANVGIFDGDGLPLAGGPPDFARGVGLVEPNIAGAGLPGQPFDTGDNIDGFDLDRPRLSNRVFFSLDSGIFDPVIGITNSNSAQANFGGSGADIYTRNLAGGGPTQIYAQAFQLGLDPLMDDVDAMVLAENGIPGYQPSFFPYDWEGGTTDMLFFSVRRGSAVVGQIDSILGLPIEPGDLLTAPLRGPDPGTTPGIVVAAESFGLETTRAGAMIGGELDGTDISSPPTNDCNSNNVEDAVDIATGASCDDNFNGIPDECEAPGASMCECTAGLGPCGNDAPLSGCLNSTGGGGALVGTGSSSLFTDDLVLTLSGLPASQFGLFYMGPNLIQLPFGDGLRCVGGTAFRYSVQNTGPGGTMTMGPGIVATSCGSFGAPGCILMGASWVFQGWYRDPGGPCGGAFNLSNAWRLTFSE